MTEGKDSLGHKLKKRIQIKGKPLRSVQSRTFYAFSIHCLRQNTECIKTYLVFVKFVLVKMLIYNVKVYYTL